MNESFDLEYLETFTVLKGFFHIGAHHGEEVSIYRGLPTVWVEAHPTYANVLKKRMAILPNQVAIEAAVSDVDDDEVEFFVTKDEYASSLLKPAAHTSYFPHAPLTGSIKVKTVRFDTMVERFGIDIHLYNVLVLDVQGVEDRVLSGLGKFKDHFPLIVSEFFLEENFYAGNTTLDKLDAILKDDYKRVYPTDTPKLIGDALYVRA